MALHNQQQIHVGYPNTKTLNRDIIFEESNEGTLRGSSFFPPLNN